MIEIRCHTPADLTAIMELHHGIFPLLSGGLSYKITFFREGKWVPAGGRTTKDSATVASFNGTNGWTIH